MTEPQRDNYAASTSVGREVERMLRRSRDYNSSKKEVDNLIQRTSYNYIQTGCGLSRYNSVVGRKLTMDIVYGEPKQYKKKRHSSHRKRRHHGRSSTAMTSAKGIDDMDNLEIGQSSDDEDEDEDKPRPYIRFRNKAKAVKVVLKFCKVCQDTLAYYVRNESWYAILDNIEDSERRQHGSKSAFITYVPNENHELEQITFDVSEFQHDFKSGDILNEEIRGILTKLPGLRTDSEVQKVFKCMKRLSNDFNGQPVNIQKGICRWAFYDRYYRDRVIIKRGRPADGLYFLLAGIAIENTAGQPREIKPGEMFGEKDMENGCYRRSDVIIKSTSAELLYLHRYDYNDIFNSAEVERNANSLDICQKDIVFQHFPMNVFDDSKETWSVAYYRFGRLIVKDSNCIEWIYVIKSGEARVIKHLDIGKINVKARHKKVQLMKDSSDPFVWQKKLLNFVSHRDYMSSKYKTQNYHPRAITSHPRVLPQSAPAGTGSRSRKRTHTVPQERSGTKSASPAVKATPMDNGTSTLPKITISKSKEPEKPRKSVLPAIFQKLVQEKREEDAKAAKDIENSEEDKKQAETKLILDVPTIENAPRRMSNGSTGRRISSVSARKLSTIPSMRKLSKAGSYSNPGDEMAVPPFIQLESLRAGGVFGLRSVLDEEEQGPSASLVSAGCEVVQISRKFFQLHIDESVLGLIRLKHKPFPTQEELLDRLDNNLQWEKYKQDTVQDWIDHKLLLQSPR